MFLELDCPGCGTALRAPLDEDGCATGRCECGCPIDIVDGALIEPWADEIPGYQFEVPEW